MVCFLFKKILLFRPLCHIFLSEGDYLKSRNYAYTSHLAEQFSLHSQCLMNLRRFEVFGLSRNVTFHMAVLHLKCADEAQVSKLEVPERRASVHNIMYIVVFLHFNTVRNSAEASNSPYCVTVGCRICSSSTNHEFFENEMESYAS